MKNILDVFEKTVERYGQKNAFTDDSGSITYDCLKKQARAVGSFLIREAARAGNPIVICIPKSKETIVGMLGTLYSGNCYVVMDEFMPEDRMRLILENLKPQAVLTDPDHLEIFNKLYDQDKIYEFEKAKEFSVNEEELLGRRKNALETDSAYILYTSGSTGVPKGVVVTHRNVLAYTNWFIKTFDITEETIFGNQTPFYFSMSVSDVYSTIFTGATLHILNKKLFSFPIRLMEYMKQEKINTIYWVPSALSIVANTKTLDYIEVPELRKVLFAGEVMPVKQLNVWIRHMPDIYYANLFGPTETTDICAYYEVKKQFADDDSLPIGYPCDNCGLLIVDGENKQVKSGEEGELLVKGPFVAVGYYNNPDKTRAAFVQNPLNKAYPEIVYRTGDLVRTGEDGELLYCGRKDFQIKHMGYRIELGEIEAAASSIEKMEICVCIYDQAADKIIMIYQAKLEESMVMEALKKKVPHYMEPAKYIRVKRMPMNANGKIDRAWLNKNYETLE